MAIAMLASCSNNKKEKEQFLIPPSIALTKQDTINIMEQVKAYVAQIDGKHYEDAADMLYTLNNDTLVPLTAEQKKKYIMGLNSFNIYATEVVGPIIRSEKNNEVCIKAQIMENGDIKNDVGITRFYLNPVQKDGKWYLTLRDHHQEGVDNPYQH